MPYSAATSAPPRLGSDDRHPRPVDFDMAQQKRQDTLSNTAKTNDYKASAKHGMLLIEHLRDLSWRKFGGRLTLQPLQAPTGRAGEPAISLIAQPSRHRSTAQRP